MFGLVIIIEDVVLIGDIFFVVVRCDINILVEIKFFVCIFYNFFEVVYYFIVVVVVNLLVWIFVCVVNNVYGGNGCVCGFRFVIYGVDVFNVGKSLFNM